jgi:hypothetical protein
MQRMQRTNRRKRISKTSHHFGGRRLNIPPQPGEFTSRPWYPLVVRIDGPSTSLTTFNLGFNMANQLGLDPNTRFDVRLQSVKFWGATVATGSSSPLFPVVLNVLDPIGQNSVAVVRNLEQFIRYPDQVNRACCGFEYPDAQKCLSLDTTQAVNLLLMAGAGAGSVVYFHVHWRSSSTTTSLFSQDYSDMECDKDH